MSEEHLSQWQVMWWRELFLWILCRRFGYSAVAASPPHTNLAHNHHAASLAAGRHLALAQLRGVARGAAEGVGAGQGGGGWPPARGHSRHPAQEALGGLGQDHARWAAHCARTVTMVVFDGLLFLHHDLMEILSQTSRAVYLNRIEMNKFMLPQRVIVTIITREEYWQFLVKESDS